jgi:hypothetical protein
MLTTMRKLFTSTFDDDEVLALAREFGALTRLRSIHPSALCLALVSCAMGDERRSIATARRAYFALTNFMPEESSFYDRFNAGLAKLLRQLFHQALANATVEQRLLLASALEGTGLVDIEAVDGSQITLPASADIEFPSTNDRHGGLKVTATLSVLFQTIKAITLTDARTHDRKAYRLPRWLHGRLLLVDRGYAAHRLWADIEDRGGFFLTPLKADTMPRIQFVRSGVGKAHVGRRLAGDLRYWQTVDVDAEFTAKGKGRRLFRVVRFPVEVALPDGRVQVTYLWFATNLSPDTFSPEQLATLYRLRWEVEQLFRTLKMVGRLDHLQSANPHVIHAFVYATLLGMVLAHDLCALMRRHRPDVEPSPHRVTALLLMCLPGIIASIGTRRLQTTLEAFEAALWREGINPNPGRPYRSSTYARELACGP